MAQGARKAGGGLARPVQPSADLAQITGSAPLPRSQVVSKVWDHIRKNNLQNPQNKREIVADDKLKQGLWGQGPGQHVRDEQASVEPPEVELQTVRREGDPLRRVPFLFVTEAQLGSSLGLSRARGRRASPASPESQDAPGW